MKKKLVRFLLAATTVSMLAGCGSASSGGSGTASSGASAEGTSAASTTAASTAVAENGAFDDYARPAVVQNDQVSVIYLVSNMTDESNIRCENQVAIECAHRGWDYQSINYESEDNFRQYFENAIAQQPTAIIIGITQSFASYKDLVEKARNAGIGVYSNDNSVIPGVISNATMDNAEASKALMDQISADHPDGLNYTVFELAMSEVVTKRAEVAIDYDGTNGMKLLDHIDLASTGDLNTAGYTVAQTWLEQYGDDLNAIICNADTPAISAAEAIIQSGDANGDKTFVSGVDGGSSTWAYMRQNTPVKYTYSQPFEYFSHNTCEVINAIQVEGLNPGDDGCPISKVGEYITADGIVTTVDNVPKAGDSIHSVFNYYGGDPNETSAWYNWADGPGIYQVTE